MLTDWLRRFVIWVVAILRGFVDEAVEEFEKPEPVGKITVNGTTYDLCGTTIVLHRGILSAGGVEIVRGLQGTVKIVIDGPVCDIQADGDVECGDVQGYVDAGGSVKCGDVGDHVDAGGSVACGNVGEYVDAGGNVSCRDVSDYVDAGGSVDCNVIHGNVDAGGSVGIKTH